MSDPELEELKDLALSITSDDRRRVAPPADLWSGIEAEAFGTTGADVIDLTAQRERLAPASVRSRRRWAMVGAAAAAAMLAVFGLSFLGGNPDPTVTHFAQATNTDLPEAYDGTADVQAVLAGAQPQIEIDFDGDLPADEPLELWLIKPDLSDMFSLGIVDSDGSYAIPAGVDLAEYSIVDVSVEPDDGDPTHSGRSILRGQLAEAVDA